jgi:hypothetical protein
VFRSRPCPSEQASLVQARSLERQNYMLRIVKPDANVDSEPNDLETTEMAYQNVNATVRAKQCLRQRGVALMIAGSGCALTDWGSVATIAL